jgi:hypothetical protein
MITFTSSPFANQVNPAYNDSIIRFHSSITGLTKADITIAGISAPFSIYPYEGQFAYNFKDIVTALINQSGFTDTVLPDLSSDFIYSDPTLQFTLNATVNAYNSVTGETTSVSFKYIKSVEQLIGYQKKLAATSDVGVLLPSQNNFDYQVTYVEGYPFDFAIQGILSGDTYYFRNTNTGIQSDSFTAATSEVKRIFLSDGATNETIQGVLLMTSNLNNIELWVNDVLKANIKILRKESRCGVMLKWFSSNGSYSYWVFEPYYKEVLKTKDLETINGVWDNLHSVKSTSESLGKIAQQTIQISTTYSQLEKEYLLDILKSSRVEMLINQSPFMQVEPFDFIGVNVADGSFPHDTKNTFNKLKLTIELPAVNTQIY